MLRSSLTALLGAVAAVQALPSPDVGPWTNSSLEAAPQKGFELVIVYVTPPGGCPPPPTCDDPLGLPAPSPVEPPKKSPVFEHDGPVSTLHPAVHWNCDTKPATNVIPIPPTKGSEMYYGISDPTKPGHYAFLTYWFKHPSVNLDHCDHVSIVEYTSHGLTITFVTSEAFKHAVDTWNADEEIILIVYAPGCGDYEKGERCYFKVSSLDFKKGELVIIAKGKPCHPDDIIDRGETEWGWWRPRDPPKNPAISSSRRPTSIGTVTASSPKPSASSPGSHGPGGEETGFYGGPSPSASGPGSMPSDSPNSGSPSDSPAATESDIYAPGGDETSFNWVPTASASGPGSIASDSPNSDSPSDKPAATETVSHVPGGDGTSFSWAPTASASGPGAIPSDSTNTDSPSENPTATDPGVSASGTGLTPSGTSTPSPADNSTSDFGSSNGNCVAPEDTKYGLPSACLSELFDQDLDKDLGWEAMSEQYMIFLKEVAPGIGEEGDLSDADTFEDWEWKKTRRATGGPRRLRKRIDWGGLWNKYVVKPVTAAYNAVASATTISGSINKDVSWKLPDASSEDPNAKTLKDPSTKQVESPWGDSVLLKAFGNQEGDDEKKVNGYLNVFCVGCGVSGSAKIAGRAAWTPFGGFTQGEVELGTDIQFVLKLGVDAQLTYKQEFDNTLLSVGLPGLSYGVVTIGPMITVGTHVELEAEAKGKLLAGAEMGLQNAQVVIDFVNPSNSKKEGWTPYFKPVFEAEGELMLSAKLGLPLGIKCGLKISEWEKSVGLIDEPSIKGVAQVAASIGLEEGKKFSAGFTDTDGCTGISTQISWRNQLSIDILGMDRIPLLDTDDNTIARACIPLPAKEDEEGGENGESGGENGGQDGENGGENSENGGEEGGENGGETGGESGEDGGENGGEDPSEGGEDGWEEGGEDGWEEGGEDGWEEGGEQGGEDEWEAGGDEGEDGWVDEGEEDWEEGVFRRLAASPDAAANVTAPATNTNSTGKIVDLTSKIKGSGNGTNTLTYAPQAFPNKPYNDTDGYEYALLVDPEATTMVVSCANGNVYAFLVEGDDNPYCSEMWAVQQDVLVTDGAQRVMHYYNNTMAATGVSRLRLEDETNIPSTGVVVAFAPYADETSEEDYYYLAVDPNEDVFYPVVCDYEDGLGSKIFLARDPEEGVEMLKSEDLMYTVTGGKVTECYPLVLMQGQYAEGDDWNSLGDWEDMSDWELEDDWYEEEVEEEIEEDTSGEVEEGAVEEGVIEEDVTGEEADEGAVEEEAEEEVV